MKILSSKLPLWLLLLIIIGASILIYQLAYHYEADKSDEQTCGNFKGTQYLNCIQEQEQYRTCHKLKSKNSCEKQEECTWMQCKNGWDPQAKPSEFCTSKNTGLCLG